MTLEDTGTAPVDAGATDDLRLDSAETTATETTEASSDTLDSDLQAVWDKAHPARDDAGRFASRKESEPETTDEVVPETPDTEAEGQSPEPTQPEQAEKPAIEPPVSWPKEMKDKWGSLPPDAQEFIARRESEAHAKISQMGNEVATVRPVAQVIEQHRDVFSRHGIGADQGINLLLNAQRKLDENPVAAIADIARSYGVDLSVFGNGMDAGQTPQVAALQAEISNLKAQLTETTTHVRSQIEAEQKAREQQHLSTIDQFLSGKNLAESDFEELAVLIETERRLSPDRTPEQLLSAAYETFQARTPERRQAFIEAKAAETAEAQRKKAAEAKKLGSLNVKSSPGASSSARSIDDTLAEVARKYYR